jgi:hypothetical protein
MRRGNTSDSVTHTAVAVSSSTSAVAGGALRHGANRPNKEDIRRPISCIMHKRGAPEISKEPRTLLNRRDQNIPKMFIKHFPPKVLIKKLASDLCTVSIEA